MRSFATNRFTVALLVMAATALHCATVAAGELLVLPYACRVVGGEPELTPAPDQGYRVIGQREERDFTECSPANPDMCRRWKLYRFDVPFSHRKMNRWCVPVFRQSEPWILLEQLAQRDDVAFGRGNDGVPCELPGL